ncbi:MAG TPA: mechanosensitive ion channel domain-containing protein [Alphaproteobacteria bacterium]|nr:mechanosensitive ion channel domain-containing protein [Alphaproteobacteria bacterium]
MNWFDPNTVQGLFSAAYQWLMNNVFTAATLIQLVVVVATYFLAWFLERRLQQALIGPRAEFHWVNRAATIAKPLFLPVLWLVLLSIGLVVYGSAGFPYFFVRLSTTLLSLWVVIRLAANLLQNPILQKSVAVVAWIVAALNIAGWLTPTINFLDSLAFTVGQLRLSVYSILLGLVTIVVLVWLAGLLSKMIEVQIDRSSTLTPSAKALFSKILKFTLVTIALVVGLTSTGIDLTAFAVFSGAVGVGIGFGLQKVISNLISGVILLIDRSIKPGDVIMVGDTYGWINSLAARYTSVITRDGQEHLIPNEDMITRPVVNWTYTSSKVRQRLAVSIAYKSDLRKAMALMLEAARETKRVIEDPPLNCLVIGFGDNGVDLELRMWIQDPQNGVRNVKSDVYLKIWDKFHENGIEFPFPQRDIHIVDGTLNLGRASKSPAK